MVKEKNAQEAIFNCTSEFYDEMYKEFNERVKKWLNEEVYSFALGPICLDIGNGGQAPAELFCEENMKKVKFFLAGDINQRMISRKKYNFRFRFNAHEIPFANSVCDSILIRQLLHHLGLGSGESRNARLLKFLEETDRVVNNAGKIVIFEPVVPRMLEWIQLTIIHLVFFGGLGRNYVPICMFSKESLIKAVRERKIPIDKMEISSFRRFANSYFSLEVPFLALPWFKLPIFCQPYRLLTLVLKKGGSDRWTFGGQRN